MKNNVKDIDGDIDFSEVAFNKRFRRVSEDELPEPVRKRREAARRKLKNRVTIYLDSHIVIRFKEIAEKSDVGYQTLINDALRTIVDSMAEESEKENLKEDILRDKKFLRRLKAAMSV